MKQGKYLITDPAIYINQETFDKKYRNYKHFVIINPDYSIEAICNYLPNINDLVERGRLIAPISTALESPSIDDFSADTHVLIYREGSGVAKIDQKTKENMKEREMLLDQLPEEQRGLFKKIFGYGKSEKGTPSK